MQITCSKTPAEVLDSIQLYALDSSDFTCRLQDGAVILTEQGVGKGKFSVSFVGRLSQTETGTVCSGKMRYDRFMTGLLGAATLAALAVGIFSLIQADVLTGVTGLVGALICGILSGILFKRVLSLKKKILAFFRQV